MLTYICSLFEVFNKPITTHENRLVCDFKTVNDAYQSFKVNDAAFIWSKPNISNAFTKVYIHSTINFTL